MTKRQDLLGIDVGTGSSKGTLITWTGRWSRSRSSRTGLVSEDSDWTTHSGTVEPTAGAREIYQTLYEVYRELHQATADLQAPGRGTASSRARSDEILARGS